MRSIRPIIILSLTALICLGSCAKRLRIDERRQDLTSTWPMFRRSPVNTGSLAADGYQGRLDIIWEAGTSGKPAGPLSIVKGMICYPSAKNRLLFYDTQTGKYLGRLKTKGGVATGLAVSDSLGIYAIGPRRSRLVCVDLFHRKQLWQMPLRDAAGGTIIIENLVLAASSDGMLTALRLTTGQEVWVHRDSGRFVAPPTVADDLVLQPVDGGRLLILNLSDGSLRHEVRMPGRLVSAVAVDGLGYVTTLGGRLCAVELDHGSVLWQATLNGDCWVPPAVSQGRVFVTTSRGSVEAFDALSGDRLWRRSIDGVIRAPATVVGPAVIAATLTGQVVGLDAATGELVSERRLSHGVDQPAVSDGLRVYVASRAGQIICFGDANAERSQNHHGNDPVNQFEGVGPLTGSRTCYGSPQGLHLRGGSSHGHASGREAVCRPQSLLPVQALRKSEPATGGAVRRQYPSGGVGLRR
ncbi:MAG: PQQ-binding-like beta-propeller repeat protein [bacterium]